MVRPPAAETLRRRGDDGLNEGLALSLSSAIGSVAGLLSWIVATRLVAPVEVGRAAQLVAAFILISGATQLNLGVGLLRWIPAAGRFTSRLVWSSLMLILPLGALVGLGYVHLDPAIGRTAAGDGPFWLGVLLFVLAAAGWTVFVVHDFILVAIGRPWWFLAVGRDPHRAAELAATARRRLVVVFLPLLAFGAVVAGSALDLVFGPEYAEAADVLRLLLVGLAFRLVVLHELGVRQAIGRALAYARLQLISTVAVIVLVALVPVGAADVAALIPVAVGYIAVQVICAAAVLLAPARRRPTDVEVVSP